MNDTYKNIYLCLFANISQLFFSINEQIKNNIFLDISGLPIVKSMV